MVDKIEIAWTVAVALIVGWVFFESYETLAAIEPPPGGTTDLQVTASRFVWKFEYPDGSSFFASDRAPLYLVTGEPVRMILTSTDVIHSWFVPELGVKLDAVPGRINEIGFVPSVAGEFVGRCTEFCGVGHHAMTFPLVVFNPGDEGRPAEQTYGPPPAPEPAPEEPVQDGGDGNQTTGREVPVTLKDFAIVPKTITAQPGETLTFALTNEGPSPHNFQVIGKMAQPSATIDSGNTDSVTLTFDEAGTYKYICEIPGHEQLGMKGELVVGGGGSTKKEGGGIPGFDVALGLLAVLAGIALFARTRRRRA